MNNYDLVIIGSGPGGYEAAIEASKHHGMKTAMIENRDLGGTCLNRGCIPTKTMLYSADMYSIVKANGNAIGLTETENTGFDVKRIQERKDEVLVELRNGIASLMKVNHIDVLEGTGTIVDKNHVKVTAADGSVEEVETKFILIATGSVPSLPPIKGIDLPGVITSDELLDNKKYIKSLVVIGGGVIGMEFASIYSAFGCTVTVVEALDRILATTDKEISQNLKMIMKKHNVDIHTKAMVTEITKSENGDNLVCHYTEKDISREVEAESILVSVGRRAFTEGIFDDKTSDDVKAMTMDRGKITVDDKYMTSVPGIYAIGDVIGGIQLAHVATAEGRCAVAYMNDKAPNIDMNAVPSCVYTNPEIGTTGLTADKAKEKGIDVITRKYTMNANGKSILTLQERGFIKIVADAETHKVLGAQMMCARATDMISQFSQAIVNGLTLEDIAKNIYPHPTYSEGIGEALR